MIPGFAAHESLYSSPHCYMTWNGGTVSGKAGGADVWAAASPAPTCGPCQADQTSATGCSKTCWHGGEPIDTPCRGCAGACVQCAPGQACCIGGAKTCCGTTCVDLNSDAQNCGGCNVACSPTQVCCFGRCIERASVWGRVCSGCTGSGCPSPLVNDWELETGDVLVFVPTDTTGSIIDTVTGNYGYSHVGLVVGAQMYDVDNTNDPSVPQVEAVDLVSALQRNHAGCQLGLTPYQAGQLASCVMAQVGERMDWLEMATFGALNIPGREICTMLIMHCLDQIGFNRSSIGLGGFVSPNEVAEVCMAPKGGPPTGVVGPPPCCPGGTMCKCGGTCVTRHDGVVSCVDGQCLGTTEQCR